MKPLVRPYLFLVVTFFVFCNPIAAGAWHDETHLAIARAAGYPKWYNAAGADMAKLKAGKTESHNHFANNSLDTVVTHEMVLSQIGHYNQIDGEGHLYGAILASLREYRKAKQAGEYAEYHKGYCAHYVGDLSMPLHNIVYDEYNRIHHSEMDGIINDDVLQNLYRIEIYPVDIESEADLAAQIARIANLSITLANRLEEENRQLTREEAYLQISHSASLLRAILKYADSIQ